MDDTLHNPDGAIAVVAVVGDCQRALFDAVVQAQCSQYQILAAWGTSLAAINQEMWDQWRCRFGGGVPLDG